MNNLAETYRSAGDLDRARQLWEEELAEKRKGLRPGSLELATQLSTTAMNLLKARSWIPAEEVLRESLEIWQRIKPDHWVIFDHKAMLGGALAGQAKEAAGVDNDASQKRFAAAESSLLEGFQGMLARQDKIPPAGRVRINQAAQRLFDLYQSWKKEEEAEKWGKKLEELR